MKKELITCVSILCITVMLMTGCDPTHGITEDTFSVTEESDLDVLI